MSPNIFLFWEAIKQGVQENFKIFDFGRTPPTNPSLIELKSRWGTSVLDLYCFYYPIEAGHGIVSAYSKRYKMLRILCKYAPPFVQSSIGEFCYKHSG